MSYAKQIAEAVLWELAINYQYITVDQAKDVDVDAIIASVPKPPPDAYMAKLQGAGIALVHADVDGAIPLYIEPVHNTEIKGAR